MNLYRIALATLASFMVIIGFGANAADSSEQQKLNSAEEVEAMLKHLGLYDEKLAFEEESAVFGEEAPTQLYHHRGGGGGNWGVGRRRPPRRRPPHRRPPRRRWDDDDHWRRRPAPPRHRETVCYVVNARGESFRGRAYSPQVARERAARKCYRYSRRCYNDGCYSY